MENKKYLDKVVGHIVKGTKIDYENELVIFPHFSFLFPYSSLTRYPYVSLSSPSYPHLSFSPSFLFSSPFSKYCAGMFGLTPEEIGYVWKEYVKIIKDKISKREP